MVCLMSRSLQGLSAQQVLQLTCLGVAQKQSDELINDFEAPLKEAVRAVKACQAVMSDRAHALQAVQSAKADQEARRTKLNKLRGIPGIKVSRRSSCLSSAQVHIQSYYPAFASCIVGRAVLCTSFGSRCMKLVVRLLTSARG